MELASDISGLCRHAARELAALPELAGVTVLCEEDGDAWARAAEALSTADGGVALMVRAGQAAPAGRDAEGRLVLECSVELAAQEVPALNRADPSRMTALQAAETAADALAGDDWRLDSLRPAQVSPDGGETRIAVCTATLTTSITLDTKPKDL